MAKTSRKVTDKKKRKARRSDPPVSLYGTSFLNVVDTLLARKPKTRTSKIHTP